MTAWEIAGIAMIVIVFINLVGKAAYLAGHADGWREGFEIGRNGWPHD